MINVELHDAALSLFFFVSCFVKEIKNEQVGLTFLVFLKLFASLVSLCFSVDKWLWI